MGSKCMWDKVLDGETKGSQVSNEMSREMCWKQFSCEMEEEGCLPTG